MTEIKHTGTFILSQFHNSLFKKVKNKNILCEFLFKRKHSNISIINFDDHHPCVMAID